MGIFATVMKTVFLGGTCNGSDWRQRLIPLLKIDYYNPVVSNWNETFFEKEMEIRQEADFCLYVITPKMTGFYAVAEIVDDSNKRPKRTIFCFLKKDGGVNFSEHQLKSLERVGQMVENNGATWLHNLEEIAHYLNIT